MFISASSLGPEVAHPNKAPKASSSDKLSTYALLPREYTLRAKKLFTFSRALGSLLRSFTEADVSGATMLAALFGSPAATTGSTRLANSRLPTGFCDSSKGPLEALHTFSLVAMDLLFCRLWYLSFILPAITDTSGIVLLSSMVLFKTKSFRKEYITKEGSDEGLPRMGNESANTLAAPFESKEDHISRKLLTDPFLGIKTVPLFVSLVATRPSLISCCLTLSNISNRVASKRTAASACSATSIFKRGSPLTASSGRRMLATPLKSRVPEP